VVEMDEIQFIVSRLNEQPFSKGLTLVDFDEKSPAELLQLLVDVLGELDTQLKCDVRETNKLDLVTKLLAFLAVVRFPMPDESEREHYGRTLGAGDKVVIYPILHWVLQRLPQVQKRAYLARFLLPVEIPGEFMQDDMLAEIHQAHKGLQEQFKEVHKQLDQLRSQPSRPGEMKTEITTLEDERKQLIAKIERLKKQNSEEEGFAPLLEATSKLRQQQDEEARLGDNMRKQRMALQHAHQRNQEVNERLSALKRGQGANMSAEAMLQQLQREVVELQQRVEGVMPRELEQQTQRLGKLQEQMYEPQRTREDVEALRGEVEALDHRCTLIRRQIDEDFGSRNDNKLAMFRQTALAAAKKLTSKEEEKAVVERERAKLAREAEELEGKLSEVSGSKFMTREEFKAYGNSLREKTQVYKQMKNELPALRAEAVVLHRTEQILRGRDKNLDDFLQQLEARRGVSGYRDTQEKLERAAENNRTMDEHKEQTLEEISSMVREINGQLKEKKTVLAPEIKKLRDLRNQCKTVENEYNQKKQLYDKVAVGLEAERQQIEAQCDSAQAECLQEESSYHYLSSLLSIAEADLERVESEVQWEHGHGQLLPNFKTYSALFQEKIERQKSMADQLRKHRAGISKNEGTNMQQRSMFIDLSKLLNAKFNSQKKMEDQMMGFGASEFDIGSAKVMRLDES